MVVRAEGKVNGLPIILTSRGGDEWEALIPPVLNGVYIVELTAWDEFGNITSIAKYILTYDPVNLCACLEPYPYKAELMQMEFEAQAGLSDYYAELLEPARCCRNGVMM